MTRSEERRGAGRAPRASSGAPFAPRTLGTAAGRRPGSFARLLRGAVMGLVAAAAALGTPARAAEVTALLADGRTVERAALKPGNGPEEVTLERPGEPPLRLPARELLSLEFARSSGPTLAPSVRLANGDTIVGRVSFPSARQVRIAAGWGTLTVPLAWCAAIRIRDGAELPAGPPPPRDLLLLGNDRVEGEVQGVAGGKVSLLLPGGATVPVELSRVVAILLAPRSHPPETGGGLVVALDLGGGERLTGRWLRLGPDLLSLRTEWGDTVDVPLASLARVEVKNGKLVYLSDLKPAEVRQVPYLVGSHPFQVDRAVSGRPLQLGGKTYRRGLGTHSRCELIYALDGGFQSFAATIGIDDSVGANGSVIYRVYGDEKLLYESPILRGGDPPVEIHVEVRRVLLLRLEVDFADGGDAADHANWAEARLLRQ